MKYTYIGHQPLKLVANKEVTLLNHNEDFEMLKKEYEALHDMHQALIVESKSKTPDESDDDDEVEDKE